MAFPVGLVADHAFAQIWRVARLRNRRGAAPSPKRWIIPALLDRARVEIVAIRIRVALAVRNRGKVACGTDRIAPVSVTVPAAGAVFVARMLNGDACLAAAMRGRSASARKMQTRSSDGVAFVDCALVAITTVVVLTRISRRSAEDAVRSDVYRTSVESGDRVGVERCVGQMLVNRGVLSGGGDVFARSVLTTFRKEIVADEEMRLGHGDPRIRVVRRRHRRSVVHDGEIADVVAVVQIALSGPAHDHEFVPSRDERTGGPPPSVALHVRYVDETEREVFVVGESRVASGVLASGIRVWHVDAFRFRFGNPRAPRNLAIDKRTPRIVRRRLASVLRIAPFPQTSLRIAAMARGVVWRADALVVFTRVDGTLDVVVAPLVDVDENASARGRDARKHGAFPCDVIRAEGIERNVFARSVLKTHVERAIDVVVTHLVASERNASVALVAFVHQTADVVFLTRSIAFLVAARAGIETSIDCAFHVVVAQIVVVSVNASKRNIARRHPAFVIGRQRTFCIFWDVETLAPRETAIVGALDVVVAFGVVVYALRRWVGDGIAAHVSLDFVFAFRNVARVAGGASVCVQLVVACRDFAQRVVAKRIGPAVAGRTLLVVSDVDAADARVAFGIHAPSVLFVSRTHGIHRGVNAFAGVFVARIDGTWNVVVTVPCCCLDACMVLLIADHLVARLRVEAIDVVAARSGDTAIGAAHRSFPTVAVGLAGIAAVPLAQSPVVGARRSDVRFDKQRDDDVESVKCVPFGTQHMVVVANRRDGDGRRRSVAVADASDAFAVELETDFAILGIGCVAVCDDDRMVGGVHVDACVYHPHVFVVLAFGALLVVELDEFVGRCVVVVSFERLDKSYAPLLGRVVALEVVVALAFVFFKTFFGIVAFRMF
jgi:hypothetical protein